MRQAARDEADEAEDPDRFLREQEEASQESDRKRRTKGRGRGKGKGKGGKGRGRGKAKAEPKEKVGSHKGKDKKEDSDGEDAHEPCEGNPRRNAQKNEKNDETEARASKNATPNAKKKRKGKAAMSPKIPESPFLKRAKTNREREREEKSEIKKVERQARLSTTDANPKPKRSARTKLARQLETDFAAVADESGGGGEKPASPALKKTPNSKRKKNENAKEKALETQLRIKKLCYDKVTCTYMISKPKGCFFCFVHDIENIYAFQFRYVTRNRNQPISFIQHLFS